MDIQSAVTQRAGIGRYTRQMAEMFPVIAPDIHFRFAYFNFRGKAEVSGINPTLCKPIKYVPGSLISLLWKRFTFPSFDLLSGEADVFHFPNFTIPPLSHGAAVVNIHDVSFINFPEFAEKRNLQFLSATLPRTINRADAVITGSKYTAEEIKYCFRISSEKVFAVYNGISPLFTPRSVDEINITKSSLGIDKPYFLFVGTIEPRKNLTFLFKVFDLLDDFDGILVIAGMAGWKYEGIIESMRKAKRAKLIKWIKYIDDKHLPSLYAGAECFIMPSFYEGFGFPPLEAMACGTPVVSSAGGSLKEVLGDAALIVDNFDPEEWKNVIIRVISDTDLRKQLKEKGIMHASKFKWEKTAIETLNILRSFKTR